MNLLNTNLAGFLDSGYFWIFVFTIIILLEVLILAFKNFDRLFSPFEKDEIGGKSGIFAEIDYYSRSALTLASLTFFGITFLVSTFYGNLESIKTELIIFIYGFFLFVISYRLDVIAGVRRVFWELKQRTLIYGLYALVLGSSIIIERKIGDILPLIIVAWIVLICIHLKEDYDSLGYYDTNTQVKRLSEFFESERTKKTKELVRFLNSKLEIEGFTNGVRLTKENYDILAPLSFSSSPIAFPEDLANNLKKEEILAICYHELAHIKYRHWFKDFILFLAIFIPYMIGTFFLQIPPLSLFGILFSIFGAFIILLLIARFHRNLEYEADEYASLKVGVEIFLSALEKYNRWNDEIGESRIPFFERLTNLPFIKKALNWLQSFAHPSFEERNENLREKIGDLSD